MRELSDELDKQRMDGRERETLLINDLTKSRKFFQEVKEELVKTQDLLCAKRTENESVRAENAVYLKEVSATLYLHERAVDWFTGGRVYKECSCHCGVAIIMATIRMWVSICSVSSSG